jgi:hypothetical protein
MRALECLQFLLDFQYYVFLLHPVPDCSLDHAIRQANYGLESIKWSVCTHLSQFDGPFIA